MFNKAGKTEFGTVAVVILVLLGIGMYTGYIPIGKASSLPDGSPAAATPVAVVSSSGVPMTYSTVDKFTNAAAGGTVQIRVKNAGKTEFNAPATAYATASVGDEIEYLQYNASQFSEPVRGIKVGYSGQAVQGKKMDNTSNSVFTVSDPTTLTILTNGGGANNVTIGSGGSASLNFNVKAASQGGLAPFGAFICLETSKTVFDQTLTRLVGVGTATSSIPQVITPAAAANAVKCYDYTGDLSDGKSLTGTIEEKAITGQNPTVGNNAILHIVPKNYFVDVDGSFVLGTQDANNNNKAPIDLTYTWAHI